MKVESIEEYLARGGKVDVLPPKGFQSRNILKVRGTGSVMSLSEGGELYGEKTKAEMKPKAPKAALDLSLIPSDLLEKLRAMGEKV